MVLESDSDITLVPRLLRMYLALWLIRRWRLPATPALILPVAVILKRFLAPDLGFSFGISRPRPRRAAVLSGRDASRTAMACRWASPPVQRRGFYANPAWNARKSGA